MAKPTDTSTPKTGALKNKGEAIKAAPVKTAASKTAVPAKTAVATKVTRGPKIMAAPSSAETPKKGAPGKSAFKSATENLETNASQKSAKRKKAKIIYLKKYKNFQVQMNTIPELSGFPDDRGLDPDSWPEDNIEAVFDLIFGRRKRNK